MKRNTKVCLWLVALAIVLTAVVALIGGRGEVAVPDEPRVAGDGNRVGHPLPVPRDASDAVERPGADVGEADDSAESDSEKVEEPQTEEEKREAEEEKLVNDFDNLTDKWQEPSAKGVTMADIDAFAKSFRKVPKARQDECIHRALNLIPDENVMLLAGVLMDKTMDKEVVETVYNDILNRDEDVKKPILQEIFKDKTHPCWADTAWILDVTGELPRK